MLFRCFWRLPGKQSMCLEESKTASLQGRLNILPGRLNSIKPILLHNGNCLVLAQAKLLSYFYKKLTLTTRLTKQNITGKKINLHKDSAILWRSLLDPMVNKAAVVFQHWQNNCQITELFTGLVQAVIIFSNSSGCIRCCWRPQQETGRIRKESLRVAFLVPAS